MQFLRTHRVLWNALVLSVIFLPRSSQAITCYSAFGSDGGEQVICNDDVSVVPEAPIGGGAGGMDPTLFPWPRMLDPVIHAVDPGPTPEPAPPIDSCYSESCVNLDAMTELANQASLERTLERFAALITPPSDPSAPRNSCLDVVSGNDPAIQGHSANPDHQGASAYLKLQRMIREDSIQFTTTNPDGEGSWWGDNFYFFAMADRGGDKIWINPWAWAAMDDDQRLAALAHELGHNTSAEEQNHHCESYLAYAILGLECNALSEAYTMNVARGCGIPHAAADHSKWPRPKPCNSRCTP